MHFEAHADCPRCRVESALSETWDTDSPTFPLGVPVATRCRLCAHECEGFVATPASPPGEGERASHEDTTGNGCPNCGAVLAEVCRDAHRCPYCGALATLRETAVARPLATASELEAALLAWAREEGLSTTRELLESSFTELDVHRIHLVMRSGGTVETTFDVGDYLFAGGGGGGSASGVTLPERAPLGRESVPPPVRRSLPPPSLRRYGGPREELLALASVAAADGEANEADRAVLVAAAEKRQVRPLEPYEIRVFRPNEIDPPPTLQDRERVLQEMFQMAWADGQFDESELRVIRDFGRVWGIDPDKLQEWIQTYSFGDAGAIDRWLRRMAQFLFPER